jgi:hypothetical protein
MRTAQLTNLSRFPLRARAKSSLIQSGVSPCPPASRPFTRRRRRRRSTSRSVLCTERGAVQSCTLRPTFCFPLLLFCFLPPSCHELLPTRFPHILLPSSCLPSFCSLPPSFLPCNPDYLIPAYSASFLLPSLFLLPTSSASLLLPSLILLPAAFLLPPFPLILLPSSCLPSFCFLLPSSHVLLTNYFRAYSASLLLPSLSMLPTSFLPCAHDYLLSCLFCFLTLVFPYSAFLLVPSLFWCPPPSWNILLPISFPACPAS